MKNSNAMRRIAIGFIMALLLPLGLSNAQEVTGVPRIVDGDTVVINGTRVRLQGIDAPETDQFCLNDKGQPADCGKAVRDRLIEKSAGRAWTCKVSGQDVFKRSLASCYVGGEDIQRWMVHSGYALAYKQYSHAYDADENAAREARAGLWSGAFIAPWDWRHRNTSTEILGAVSVPIGAQKILLRPDSGITNTVAPPIVHTSAPPTVHATTTHTTSHLGHCQNPGDRASNGSRCGKRAASARHKN